MAYCLLWSPLLGRTHQWVVPGDIWGAFRSAQFVGWGDLGNVYGAGTGLVTFPGILLLFAPVAMITGAFGMTASFPFQLPHPTSWLVLGPYEILISCSALFACDALAERLGVTRGRRRVLCVAEGLVLWNISVYWGHPEDAVAVALAVYALVLAFEGRWGGAGWLFGAAAATQPVVVLMLPVLLAFAGKNRALPLLVRASLPSVLLLATPLVAEFHATIHALVDQPNFPNIDHRTPWTSLAPHLGGSGQGLSVAAGPGRLVAIALACATGWRARRWRDHPETIVMAAAFTLALRCFTESVMVSFYVWPVLAVGLVMATRGSSWRWVFGVAAAVGVTVCSNSHLGEWAWWGLVNGGIAVLLWTGNPSRPKHPLPIDTSAADSAPAGDRPPVLVGARS
ncbi:MAG: hypothetical protein ACRDYC_08965, partial [Acidimicrobiales bacterium]